MADSNSDTGDASAVEPDDGMVAAMRAVLALSVLLAVFVDPSSLSDLRGPSTLAISAYAAYSIALYLCTRRDWPITQTRVVHWLDVAWFGLIIISARGVDSVLFLFFFVAILPASFRWGANEGTQITIASAIVFVSIALLSSAQVDAMRLLLRSTFLLALGYLIAHWGGAKLELNARLELLREVSRLSNPRFGLDFNISRVQQELRTYFDGDACLLVVGSLDGDDCVLRVARAGAPVQVQPVTYADAAPLLGAGAEHILAFSGAALWHMPIRPRPLRYCPELGRWTRGDGQTQRRLADLLDARSFISAPLRLSHMRGRIYITSRCRFFSKSDALFLSHAGAQGFLAVDNLALLDELASEAAAGERQKISLDLHDSTIQPYMGLRLGLLAMRRSAAADNPLVPDLDKLLAIADATIAELRTWARAIRERTAGAGACSAQFLRHQVARAAALHGIDVRLDIDSNLAVNDRLMAEILQIVREGLSNMARHAAARQATIAIGADRRTLRIDMENDSLVRTAPFIPVSITQRARALGGQVRVDCAASGNTLVHVEIPL